MLAATDGDGFNDFAKIRAELDKNLLAPLIPVVAEGVAPVIPDDWGQDEETESAFAQLGNIPVN